MTNDWMPTVQYPIYPSNTKTDPNKDGQNRYSI